MDGKEDGMAHIRIAERGGEIPSGVGVTDDEGFPLTDAGHIGANAWALWRATLSRGIKTGALAQPRDGVLGLMLSCRLAELEKLIWPVMRTAEDGTLFSETAAASEALRDYLASTGNLSEMGPNRWWVRSVWNSEQPDEPEAEADPQPEQEQEEQRRHPGGRSLPADILACLGDDDAMHLADLVLLLDLVSPARYAGLTPRSLQALMKDASISTGAVRISMRTKLGVLRPDVERALEREQDQEAAEIVADAHALAGPKDEPVLVREGPAALVEWAARALPGALAAILEEHAALTAKIESQAAEIERLKRQPVSQEIIDKALASYKAEIDRLTFDLRAARRIRS
jgi:hypothetical protein